MKWPICHHQCFSLSLAIFLVLRFNLILINIATSVRYSSCCSNGICSFSILLLSYVFIFKISYLQATYSLLLLFIQSEMISLLIRMFISFALKYLYGASLTYHFAVVLYLFLLFLLFISFLTSFALFCFIFLWLHFNFQWDYLYTSYFPLCSLTTYKNFSVTYLQQFMYHVT